jgi:hypothetical protein
MLVMVRMPCSALPFWEEVWGRRDEKQSRVEKRMNEEHDFQILSRYRIENFGWANEIVWEHIDEIHE